MRILVSLFIGFALCVGQVRADIALTTTSGLSFAQNSGNHTFQVFAQGAVSDPSILALISTITIDSGTVGLGNFVSPISFASNFNPSNVNGSSSGLLDPLDNRVAYLSLDFTNPQAIPTGSPGVVGTLTFNVNGLAPGFYDILLSDFASDGPPVTATNGQFQITGITAVPEPSSVLTGVSLGALSVFYRRRRRQSAGR